MLQQSTRAPGKAKKSGGTPEASTPAAPDKQTRVGNAAMQQSVQNEGNSAIGNDEISSWLGAEKEPPHGASTDGPVGPMRPAAVQSGKWGALIGPKDTVELTGSMDGSGEKFTVPDGKTCKIVEAKGDKIKVEVRVDKEKKQGWCASSLFSEQPMLNKDDDAVGLQDDFIYAKQKGDHSPTDPKGNDTAQGALGDCYFIASMAAIANASPQAIKDAIKYNPSTETYTVRFYEESGWGGDYKPVYIEVDSYLPTVAGNRNDPAYAGEPSGKMWPAIMEKAYAKWKGSYQAMGNGGYGAQSMAEITGARSSEKNPKSMKEEEVIPYFEKAKKDGMAIYAAVENNRQSDAQMPFRGSGDGPFSATISHTHRWNHIVPGTMRVTDKAGKMKGTVSDNGKEGDHSAKLTGSPVDSGSVDYKANTAEMKMKAGQGPAKAEDLELRFAYQGAVNAEKLLVANHAYAFEGVVGGKELQFYNPWGTWQPKPITPAEFLKHFTNISTNKAPQGATKA